MIVALVRHGDTAWNSGEGRRERLRGWEREVLLTNKGKQEAHEAAQELAQSGHVSRIVCSDLPRARQSGEIIQKALGRPITFDHRLRPWNFGVMTGQYVDEMLPEMLRLERDAPEEKVKGGESFHDYLARFLPFLWGLMQEAVRRPLGGMPVAVAHARNMNAARAWIAAGAQGITVDPKALEPRPSDSTGDVAYIYREGDRWKME